MSYLIVSYIKLCSYLFINLNHYIVGVFLSAVSQMKPAIGSLKRKSESDMTGEMTSDTAAQNCPSIPDSAPPLSPAPSLDTGESGQLEQLQKIHQIKNL